MKNDRNPVIEYGSKRTNAETTAFDPETRHEPDQDSAVDAFLPTAQLRQLRMELQQRRISRKSPWRRRLERLFRWLA